MRTAVKECNSYRFFFSGFTGDIFWTGAHCGSHRRRRPVPGKFPLITQVAPAEFVAPSIVLKPTIGLTFQIGGYTTPFAVMGSALFLSAIMTAFVLPGHVEPEEDTQQRCECLYIFGGAI